MAANMFILVDGAPGDATEGNHKDWIVIESATFELERAVDMADLGSNQRSHANTNFQKVEVTSQIGKASNKLALSVANGTVRPEITMHWCRSGDDASEGLKPFSMLGIQERDHRQVQRFCQRGWYSRRNMGNRICRC